jgi:hypothetical protein
MFTGGSSSVIIKEWDGTQAMVSASKNANNNDVNVMYTDGITHTVSLDYFYSVFVRFSPIH